MDNLYKYLAVQRNFRSICTEEERDSFGLDEQGRELGPWHGGRGSFAS